MSEYYVSEGFIKKGDLVFGVITATHKLNEFEKEISRLKKEVELLEKSNNYYTKYKNITGLPARQTQEQLKELRSKEK